MNVQKPIPTFVINLRSRKDRREHILDEFKGRNEFNVKIVDAFEHTSGAIGLWNTITEILKNSDESDDYILICEDDHQFTNCYSKERLFYCINEAKNKNADILSGGVSWLSSSLEVAENIFWVENFSGLQFTIIFRAFFKTLLNSTFEVGEAADYKFSALSVKKFFIYPFVSTQREFGYSDVTKKNSDPGHVEELFKRSEACVLILDNLCKAYQQQNIGEKKTDYSIYENVTLPTYVINKFPGNDEHLAQIKRTFDDRKELSVSIVDCFEQENSRIAQWISIRSIIQEAVNCEDDLVIICEDVQEFTKNYSKEVLLENILEAHEQGVDYLSGGAAGFTYVSRITKNRFWIDTCLSSPFIVLYKKVFKEILDDPFSEDVIPENKLSELASNKMVIYPFISVRNSYHIGKYGPNDRFDLKSTSIEFIKAEERLSIINKAYKLYIERDDKSQL